MPQVADHSAHAPSNKLNLNHGDAFLYQPGIDTLGNATLLIE